MGWILLKIHKGHCVLHFVDTRVSRKSLALVHSILASWTVKIFCIHLLFCIYLQKMLLKLKQSIKPESS